MNDIRSLIEKINKINEDPVRPDREGWWADDDSPARDFQGYNQTTYRGKTPFVIVNRGGQVTRIWIPTTKGEQELKALYPNAIIYKSGTEDNPQPRDITPSANTNPVNRTEPENDYKASLANFVQSDQKGLANNPEATGAITELNTRLSTLGFNAVTGSTIYDIKTINTVKGFQKAYNDMYGQPNKIRVDGDLGPVTFRALTAIEELFKQLDRQISTETFISSIAREIVKEEVSQLTGPQAGNLTRTLVQLDKFLKSASENGLTVNDELKQKLVDARLSLADHTIDLTYEITPFIDSISSGAVERSKEQTSTADDGGTIDDAGDQAPKEFSNQSEYDAWRRAGRPSADEWEEQWAAIQAQDNTAPGGVEPKDDSVDQVGSEEDPDEPTGGDEIPTDDGATDNDDSVDQVGSEEDPDEPTGGDEIPTDDGATDNDDTANDDETDGEESSFEDLPFRGGDDIAAMRRDMLHLLSMDTENVDMFDSKVEEFVSIYEESINKNGDDETRIEAEGLMRRLTQILIGNSRIPDNVQGENAGIILRGIKRETTNRIRDFRQSLGLPKADEEPANTTDTDTTDTDDSVDTDTTPTDETFEWGEKKGNTFTVNVARGVPEITITVDVDNDFNTSFTYGENKYTNVELTTGGIIQPPRSFIAINPSGTRVKIQPEEDRQYGKNLLDAMAWIFENVWEGA